MIQKTVLFGIITGLCLFSMIPLKAQRRLKRTKALRPGITEGYVSAGVQLNAVNYFGDVSSNITFTRPGIAAFIERKISPKIHTRLQLAWGRLEGDDFSSGVMKGTYARNLHFRNDVKELAVIATYDFIGSYGKHQRRAPFSPYLLAGIGLVHHNPKARIPADLGYDWIELQPLGTEGQGRPGYAKPYSKVQVVVPLGVGLKWSIDRRWDFAIETAFRITFTDYLDDVSGDYPDFGDLGNPLAIQMSNRSLESVAARTRQDRQLDVLLEQYGGVVTHTGFSGETYDVLNGFAPNQSTRGNAGSKDFYIMTGIRFSYIVNVGLKCPQFH